MKSIWHSPSVRPPLDAKELAANTTRWTETRTLSIAATVLYVASFAAILKPFLDQELNNPYAVYVAAANRFWLRLPLYDLQSPDGFQYLPHMALVVTPFALLGTPAGDLAWRAVAWTLYATGVWRLARRFDTAASGRVFLIASAASIPAAIASLGIGQANLVISAIMMHAATDVSLAKWTSATIWLLGGMACKPLVAPYMLAVMVVHRPMFRRIALLSVVFVAIPLIAAPPRYLITQYRDCASKIAVSARCPRTFEDLSGLLSRMALEIPGPALNVARCLAAGGTLTVALLARRRRPEPFASTIILAIAMAYLLLFNPRTQSNSYVLAAPLATFFMLSSPLRGRAIFGSILLAWSCNLYLRDVTALWLKPLACILFFASVAHMVARNNRSEPAVDVQQAPCVPKPRF